ncbi:MAG TPA: alanyl-tRNA editing protein, partial [Candidatus Bathyarchaeia archaeon]|nr:alanyl-tRNA editing protein [Candidatus Bathyarchaeia archaeon]
MTRKLYWEEPYSREFKAKVVAVDGGKIELDQTLFYPRGGGVSSDIGTLGGRKVTETTKDGNRIIHNLDSAAAIETGQSIEGSIDWDRRHRLMRMHTAGHLLSALFYKSNCLITGNQIDVDRSRMDFNLEVFDRSQIESQVSEANRLIGQDAQVKSYFLDREEALKVPELVKLAEAAPPAEAKLRIVEITGIDKQADGGLHVAHLNEIGRINLLKLEN